MDLTQPYPKLSLDVPPNTLGTCSCFSPHTINVLTYFSMNIESADVLADPMLPHIKPVFWLTSVWQQSSVQWWLACMEQRTAWSKFSLRLSSRYSPLGHLHGNMLQCCTGGVVGKNEWRDTDDIKRRWVKRMCNKFKIQQGVQERQKNSSLCSRRCRNSSTWSVSPVWCVQTLDMTVILRKWVKRMKKI